MKQIRLGIAPIAWSNDDLPELGGGTSLDTCLSEMAQAGYSGTETGGKFPGTAAELGPILDRHGLVLVSGWYSGELLHNSVEDEKRRAQGQVEMFRELGAFAFVYGETADSIQGRREVPLARRPSLTDAEMADYGRRVDEFAAWVNETCGAPFAYHHHIGAVVQFEDEVERFLACTADETGLLFDTGHLQFAGGDPIAAIARWGSRIRHVHCKDVRADVLAGRRLGAGLVPRRGPRRRLHRPRRRDDRLRRGRPRVDGGRLRGLVPRRGRAGPGQGQPPRVLGQGPGRPRRGGGRRRLRGRP